MIEMPTVVVIGASGQVGSALCKALQTLPLRVRAVVNAASWSNKNRENCVASTLDPTRSEVVPFRAESISVQDLTELVEGASLLVNCAGVHHDAFRFMHPAQMIDINAILVAKLALACRLASVPMVQLSSTAVTVLGEPLAEMAGVYVKAKATAEAMCGQFHPGGVSILRCGWILNPGDETARRRLTSPLKPLVIVGNLPVPIVGLSNVVQAIISLMGRPAIGTVDLVAGSPSQAELMRVVCATVRHPPRVIDVKTPQRLLRLRDDKIPPTWLAQSMPQCEFNWSDLNVELDSWQSQVISLCSFHHNGGA